MSDTPTMSVRVPQDAGMRRALRETAKALRLGQVSAAELLDWLASRRSAHEGFDQRLIATEQRVELLEAAVDLLAAECGVRVRPPVGRAGERAAPRDRRRSSLSK
ncbi:MAG TPA: hypothetical protein VGE72_26305 [Azospirillum sp.]